MEAIVASVKQPIDPLARSSLHTKNELLSKVLIGQNCERANLTNQNAR